MGPALDGKIMGRFWEVLGDLDEDPFYDVAFGPDRVWPMDGWISSCVTTDDNFTDHAEPALPESWDPVPEGDLLCDTGEPMYCISVDPRGRLGWTSDRIRYRDTDAKVLEVLTERASERFRALLRGLSIPYLVCGEETVDFSALLERLRDDFGMGCVMLGGGGTVNWSMLCQGLVDEVSVVVDPSADGSCETQTLFMAAPGLAPWSPTGSTWSPPSAWAPATSRCGCAAPWTTAEGATRGDPPPVRQGPPRAARAGATVTGAAAFP